MGKRAESLAALLIEAGLEVVPVGPSLTFQSVGAPSQDVAREVYEALGGIPAVFEAVTGPGEWDFRLADGTYVELDEEQHFNRYRQATLVALTARNLPWAADYASYCESKERRCGHRLGWWTNPSSETMFGKSDPEAVFGPQGPARWKQRAFYDALKDASDVPLARVSIYDRIYGRTLNSILRRPKPDSALHVKELVLSRIRSTVER